jgi:hypothetical protein
MDLLERDTMTVPDPKGKKNRVTDDFLTAPVAAPSSDSVTGQVKGPSGSDNVGGDAQMGPPDSKAKTNGIDDSMLRMLPNATGRMMRMKGDQP